MGAIRYWVRAARRRHRLGIVVLATLAGLGLGLTSVALTGARRADTAFTRLQVATLAPDAGLPDVDGVPEEVIATVAADPSVTTLARWAFTPVRPDSIEEAGAFIGLDEQFLDEVYRPVVIDGRRSRPGTDEVMVNEAMADLAGLEAGDRVDLVSGFEDPQPLGPATVVGIVRGTYDVGPAAGGAFLLLDAAFLDAHRDQLQLAPAALLARLTDGVDGIDAFTAAAGAAAGVEVTAFSADDERDSVQRTLDIQALALELLGLVAGLATLAAALQALTRLLDAPLSDLPVLVEMGLAPHRGRRLGVLLAVPVIVLAPVVALGVTLVGTPRVPTGFARTVDPDVGTHVDLVVVGGLFGAWVVVMLVGAALTGHRAGRPARPTVEPVRAVTRPLPLRARLGGQAALAPVRARAGGAARSALVAGVVAVTGVVAVATFTVSLQNLRDDRRLDGWDFDATLSGFEPPLDAFREAVGAIEEDPGVAAVAWASIYQVGFEHDGREVQLEGFAFDPDAGAVHPAMRSGRPPLTDDEVAVGAEILTGIDGQIGDTLTVTGPEGSADLEIVGIAPFPELGNSADIATVISLTRATAERIGAMEISPFALVRLQPGADPGLLEAYAGDAAEVGLPFESNRVQNLGEIGDLPAFLAAFLAALGLAAVLHSLLRSLRARRHDLAVLSAMGLRRRDLLAISGWQALATAVIALGLGIPLGVVGGRLAWAATAEATGVVEVTLVPVLVLLGVVLSVLLTWTVAARLLARIVLRGPAAANLRAD